MNFADLAIFRSKFATGDPAADLDGSGAVNFADLARFSSLFGKLPGQDLDRNVAIQHQVAGAEDICHATRTEFFQQLITVIEKSWVGHRRELYHS